MKLMRVATGLVHWMDRQQLRAERNRRSNGHKRNIPVRSDHSHGQMHNHRSC
jgi:hypothetical protein